MTGRLFEPDALPRRLTVRVTPKASAARIRLEHDESGAPVYRVYVTVAPEDGKANKAVIALLAKAMGVPKSALSIVRGATGRDKIIELSGAGEPSS